MNFTVSDNGAYNIRGAVPDSIVYSSGKNERNKWTPYTLYSGYSTYIRVYDPETNDYKGAAHITFTFKNNTGLGKTAKVMVRVTGGTTLTGSAEIGTYKVNTNEVSDISVFTNTTPDPGDMYYSRVYAVVTDAPKSKGKLDKPDVKLYQVYCDKKGNHKSVALSAKQYTVNTGDELGRNHIAVHTYVTGGKTGEFNFAPRYKDQGIYTGVFALYNTKLTADAISAVYVNDTGYKVNKGVIDSSFAPVFTGYKINPKVQKVTAPNAELIINSDYDLHFSINTAAGDKSGTILIQPHYNETTDIYEYGGTVTVNFKIAPAGDITL